MDIEQWKEDNANTITVKNVLSGNYGYVANEFVLSMHYSSQLSMNAGAPMPMGHSVPRCEEIYDSSGSMQGNFSVPVKLLRLLEFFLDRGQFLLQVLDLSMVIVENLCNELVLE